MTAAAYKTIDEADALPEMLGRAREGSASQMELETIVQKGMDVRVRLPGYVAKSDVSEEGDGRRLLAVHLLDLKDRIRTAEMSDEAKAEIMRNISVVERLLAGPQLPEQCTFDRFVTLAALTVMQMKDDILGRLRRKARPLV
jgi:hypothetical protein